MVRVCVEGNVGAGKSAALEALEAELKSSHPDVTVVREPADRWADLHARLRTDAGPWALPLALKALLSYAKHEHQNQHEHQHVVVERGPLACQHVFGRLLFNAGKLTQNEWELFKEYCEVLGWAPDVVAYVHTPVDQCLQRLGQGREQEAPGQAPDDDLHQHLKRLEFQYETMVRYCDVPVVRIDGTQTPEQVAAAIADVLRTALAFRTAPPAAP
jgi:thymidylate kinase